MGIVSFGRQEYACLFSRDKHRFHQRSFLSLGGPGALRESERMQHVRICWYHCAPDKMRIRRPDSFLYSVAADEDVKSYCQNLTNEIAKVTDIPKVCNMFPEVVKAMKTRIDERDAAIATQGMRAGSGNEARRALASGSLYQAQVTRRYTQTRRFSKQDKKSSW